MGAATGLAAGIIGILSSIYLIFGSRYGYESRTVYSNGTTIITSGTASAFQYGDPAVFFWAGFIIIMSISGAYGAWKNNVKIVWGAALLLSILSILGLFSIGVAVMPVAMLFIISGVLLTAGKKK